MKVLVITNLFPTEANPTQGTFVRAQFAGLRGAGIEPELLYVDRASGGRRVYRTLAGAVQTAVEEHDPALVHVMYGGVMADVTTRVVDDRPVVVTFYGRDLFGLPRSAPMVRRIASRYGVRASQRAARRASAVIVQSQVMADALRRRVDRERAWVIPDGIDLDAFVPLDRTSCQQQLGWSPSVKHVLFPYSRDRPEKRFDLASAVVSQVARSGLGAELHEVKGIRHDEFSVWLNAADALILTSTHEGSPNAVKEALACNVHVVSVAVGDVEELLSGIDGCYVADAEPADLASKLQLALTASQRPASRERMVELSVGRVAARIRHVYELVLSDAPEADKALGLARRT